MSDVRHPRAWEELAGEDPYWAVESEPQRRYGGWNRADFVASGRGRIDELLARAQRLDRPRERGSALDFGCGAGRLSRALADHFNRVVGVDVSATMVDLAQDLNADAPACEFRRLEPGVVPEERFDLVCSLLVLQHVPSRELRRSLVGNLMSAVREGGLLAIQVPSHIPVRHRLQPRPRLYAALRAAGVPPGLLYRRLGLHPIRMAALDPAEVERLVQAEGGLVRDRIDSTSSGVVSSTYYATRD